MKLFKHQLVSLKFMKDKERVFDASDPGTAKTRVEIVDFATRRRRGGGCALVLAPKSILESVWVDDAKRFEPSLTVSVARATNREEAFKSTADMYVTNIDAVVWLVKQKPIFFKRFDTLIVDESTAYKHSTNKRSKALNKIKKYFQWRRLLTGTPSGNTITDIWNQVNILDDGKRLGPSFFHFRNQVCIPEQVGPMPNMVKWVDRPGAESAVSMLIKDITIRHKFESCVDIPANHEYSINFHLNRQHMMRYNEMQETAILELSKATVSAIHAASLSTKLLQIASGAVYDENGNYHLIDKDRYDLVTDLIEARPHCIVFFLWKHQRDMLIKAAEAQGLTYCVIDGEATDKERTDAVRNFQAGFYRVCFAHPQSAAHGLTLTKGTRTIWASPTYNLEHFLQGNKRIYRTGQTEKTETIVITAPGTLEEKVWMRLQEKSLKQGDLLELLKTG